MGHNDLGDFYHARGDLNAAFKCYVRTRDYCTTPRHVVNMCLNVIRVSVESENFAQVQNYVAKATQVPDVEEPMVAAKLACAGGLAAIEARKYKLAAEKFTQLTVEVASGYDEVIGAVDIATYGGLCALASFDRSELKTHVLENPTFRTAMEVTPEVRECVEDFYNSRYSSLFDSLERLRPQLQLDLHLHDHVESLYDCIRRRSLIQYCTPFSVVDLRKMADAFAWMTCSPWSARSAHSSRTTRSPRASTVSARYCTRPKSTKGPPRTKTRLKPGGCSRRVSTRCYCVGR
jgi:COP9 signalosome complex subunit 1